MRRQTLNLIPGNAAVIYHGNTMVFREAFGYADKEAGKEMTGNELFYLYSSTKIATVVAGLKLMEQGQFTLSDPVYAFLPEYRTLHVRQAGADDRQAKHVMTLKDLFSMTAGLSYDLNSASIEHARAITGGAMDTGTVARCLAKEPLLFEPGTHWEYSLCHDVLAAVIEVVSGKRFSRFLKESIFDPLEMKRTWFQLPQAERENMAAQYWYDPDCAESGGHSNAVRRGTLTNEYVLGPAYESGGAGLISCIDDYIKLVAALSRFGLGLNGERILSASSVELLRTNQLDQVQLKDYWSRFQKGYGYGLGVRTHMDRAQSCCLSSVGEFGWSGAAGSFLLCDPKEELSVFFCQHVRNFNNASIRDPLKNVIYACLR